MALDGLEDSNLGRISMGILAQQMADEQGFTRQDQDAFSIASLERARSANFEGEIVQGGGADDLPLKANFEKIPLLRPAFGGSITAASASGIADGAAAILLASDQALSKYGLVSRAKIVGQCEFSCAPQDFTKAPVGAIEKLLSQLGWSVNDVDLFEVNEAFAVVSMYAMKALNIPHTKMNIHGGACALGHPIGASGARVIVTLLNALEKHNLHKGIAAVCIGGGEAVAVAITRG
jgi:acetyl-CoA C-acetyltransferase